MKFSIITVTLDPIMLDRCKASVDSQCCVNLEHIIKDGLSKRKYYRGSSKFLSWPDAGIYDAMNQGFSLSTGDVICYLNSDDYFQNTRCLENVQKLFLADPELDFVYGNIQYLDASGEIVKNWSMKKYKNYLPFGVQIPHPAFVCRRKVLETLNGPFDASLKISADFAQQLVVQRKGLRGQYCEKLNVSMQLGGASNHSWKAKLLGLRECVIQFKILEISGLIRLLIQKINSKG